MNNQMKLESMTSMLKISFRLVLGCAAFVVAASNCQAQRATLYKAATVYTMDGQPVSPGQVLVVDGKIQAVGKSVDLPEGGNEVDLGDGSVLMPGLVNAYSQTPLTDGSSAEITEEVTLDFRAAQAIDWNKPQLRRVMSAGTTTMNVCPGTQNVISGIASIIKTDPAQQSILSDDGALVASMCNDPASGNRSRQRPDSIYIRQPTNRMGVVWILRSTMNKAKSNPKDSQYAHLDEVFQGKRPLMMVSRMSYDLNTVGTLADEFEFSPIIVGGQEAYKTKQTLKKRGFPIVLQPLPTGVLSGPEGSELSWNQAGVLTEAGLTVALTGDDLLEQARFAHRFGLSRDKALAAITSVPAKILGLEKRVGSIAPGNDADLIALSGDPLDLTTSIRWVIVNGKPIEIQKD